MSDLTLNVNNGVVDQTSSTVTKSVPGGTLDKNAFLQLLVCQMKNQDPLQPNTDTEYVAQLATFSQLEQLQNLNSTNTQSQAFGLIGKTVTMTAINSSGNNTTIEGKVESATISNGVAYLVVNGSSYPINQLVSVAENTGKNEKNADAYALVGQNVVMNTKDKDGNDDYTLGTVEYVSFKNGEALLSIDGTSYPMSQLSQIISNSYLIQQYSLVGKTVIVDSTDSAGHTTQVQGVVDSIEYEKGEFCYSIDGKLYPCSSFVSVVVDETTSEGTETKDENDNQSTTV